MYLNSSLKSNQWCSYRLTTDAKPLNARTLLPQWLWISLELDRGVVVEAERPARVLSQTSTMTEQGRADDSVKVCWSVGQ